VLQGELIDNQLEVHLYPNRLPGWCLTFKRPLCEADEVIGVVGISRDLGQPDSRHSAYERLSQVMEHMQSNFGDNLRV
ncbi:MAG: AraC family transcriptional regulator, partial [Xanthomonas perforans]|nr:AraC family transcriptional regulator [Xanthomonas perforans]